MLLTPPACSVSGLLLLIPLERVSQTHPEVVALEVDVVVDITSSLKIAQMGIPVPNVRRKATVQSNINPDHSCPKNITFHTSLSQTEFYFDYTSKNFLT